MKNTMKWVGLLLVVLLAFAGCDMLLGLGDDDTQTKRECLEGFLEAAIATSLSDMRDYIHPSSDYSGQIDSTFLQNAFEGGGPTLQYDIISSASSNSLVVSITYPDSGGPYTETYTFKEDGSDFWKILSFTVNGTTY